VIDFRYHLVSLISVFLALAVGIVLGAGPLQGTLGNQLVEQVETLRTERNEYRAEFSQLSHDAQIQHDFIAAAGPLLAANTLNHRNIAIVLIGDVDDIDERQIVQQIRLAGGTVVETVTLTSAWWAQADASERDAVAAAVQGELGTTSLGLPDDATVTQQLGAALALALTQKDIDGLRGPATSGLDAQFASSNLVEFDGQQTVPADAILVLSGPLPGAEEADPDLYGADGFTAALPDAMGRVASVVVAGPTSEPGDLVDAVLNERRAADRISTVSGTETEMGQIQVALVLAARIAGNIGHYGFGEGNQVLPPIIPALLNPTPGVGSGLGEPATEPTGEGEAGADGEQGAGADNEVTPEEAAEEEAETGAES